MAALDEFLALVLPWQGTEESTYKSIWHKFQGDDGRWHMAGKATQSLPDLCYMARWARDKRGGDVWVGLATQRASDASTGTGTWRKANRKTANLVSHKTLFIDLDAVDKNYATTEEAGAALMNWCRDSGMPAPTFYVLSGSGGMHVYWVLDVPIPVQRWQPMANALAEAIKQHGLKCDIGVTVDAARILRVPDTYNSKTGELKPVQMSKPGTIYDAAAMEAFLQPYMDVRKVPYKSVQDVRHDYADVSRNYIDGVPPEYTHRVELTDIADAGCGVFADAIDTRGKAHGQPLWHLMCLASTWDTDPRAMAHTVSMGHPDYVPADTDAMLERKIKDRAEKNLGWPSCFKFSHEHPACKTCPHFAANKSPFHLLLKPQAPPTDDLPVEYHRNGQGHIMIMMKPGKNDEHKEPYPYCVMDYALTDARLDGATGDFWCTRNGWGDERYLHLPAKSWTTTEAFMNAAYDSRVVILPEKALHARRFFMSWVQKLQDMKQARVEPVTVGWTRNMDGFTYDARTFTAKGETRAFIADDSALRYYGPVGDEKPWRIAMNMLIGMGQPSLQALAASAFAAPLVSLGGFPGLLLTAYSQESGVGKSTALRVAQAVWGDPVRAMNALDDTPASIIKKLADVQHLPLFWDELKMRQDIDKFVTMLFRLAQGKDKARLDRNSKAREVGSFSTIICAASNDSIAEGMGRAVDNTTAGANRVFEVVVPVGPSSLSPSMVMRTIADMDRNYGHIGLRYAMWLGANHDYAKKLVKDTHADLERMLGSTREERFWVSTMAVTLVGAYFARELGYAAFDTKLLNEFLTESFHRQRVVRSDTTRDMTKAFNVNELLAELIADTQFKHMLITDKLWRAPTRPPKEEVKVLNGNELPRMQGIWLQLAKDDGVLRVLPKPFAVWIDKKGYSPSTVYAALELHCGMKRVPGKLGAGTMHVHVVDILDRSPHRVMDIQLPSGSYSLGSGSSSAI